jgi:hypothetical protein
MDQAAHRSGVLAEGNGAVKLRLEIAATLATSVAHEQLRRQEAFATLYALRHTDRFDGIQTFLTNR